MWHPKGSQPGYYSGHSVRAGNDTPIFRVDHMPYGGTKRSGIGREGPRYAIEEMTELRLLVTRT